ncbi:thiamine diphosphokinase [Candidatus Rhodobacter oscarellae]|uniref:thiamine diphosphokinase n=1 Tax=Candidatus Rhodobacter oscarellae TaxID=1675527 RepID=UPI002E14C1A2
MLVGAGDLPSGLLPESLALADTVVAADGGAAVILAEGRVPDAVIGDFDSLPAALRDDLPPERLIHIAEQDSSDFDKALRTIRAPLVLVVGFTGGRLDHELAVYNALIRHPDRPAIVMGSEDICFLLSAPLTLELPVGTRVSLFPMAELTCEAEGLLWPTEGLTFSPWGRVGTSNQASAPRVALRPSGPGMLVILPRAVLPQAIVALTGP